MYQNFKRESKKEIFSLSVKQDGDSGVKPGEQANTEPEEGGGGQQGSDQADDERKVNSLQLQLQLLQKGVFLPFPWFSGKLMA